jgi:ubiquinone/menaquinone biosynthesis C-methylase UbiE
MSATKLTSWLDRVLYKPIRHLLERPERVLKGYVSTGMTVLDVGCGAGFYSLGMARLVGPEGRVVAVDRRGEVIAELEQGAARAGLSPPIEARVCSEDDLGIDDLAGQVDFALAVYVIHHADDPTRLMSNVHRALKPGAMLLVIEPGHHASPAECEATETAAQEAGFTVADHPKLTRDWAVRLRKE